MELRELTYMAIALRIVAAVILGGILGLERGLQNRPAGLPDYDDQSVYLPVYRSG